MVEKIDYLWNSFYFYQASGNFHYGSLNCFY